MRIEPQRTLFVILSFEGPDVYSQAGGLGVRVKELSRALAEAGFETHLYFLGDPRLPGTQTDVGGLLTLHRWEQWLSSRHLGGVYEGEQAKIREWNSSLPRHLVDHLLGPAIAAGRQVVVMAEEWHTAWSIDLIDAELRGRGLREGAVLLWNANNIFGFERLDWARLVQAATVTTVSRYMKQLMRERGQEAIVIPNGIPASIVRLAPAADRRAVREAAASELFCFKIGRFDPAKRWLDAVEATARIKQQGATIRLLIRGGSEPHGVEVLETARRLGLTVADVQAPQDARGLARLLDREREAEVLNLVSFLPESLLGTIYGAADAVLANSGHEPFGLVGLEVMAAGGLAVTGSTGEDYADGYRNAIVLETADPAELVAGLGLVRERPELAAAIRKEGRHTARGYVWEGVIEKLIHRAEFAASLQADGTASQGRRRL